MAPCWRLDGDRRASRQRNLDLWTHARRVFVCSSGSLIHVSPLIPEFHSQSEDDDWHHVPVNPQDAKPGCGTPTPHPGRSWSSSKFVILNLTVFLTWSGYLNSIFWFGFSKLGLFPSLAFPEGALWDVPILATFTGHEVSQQPVVGYGKSTPATLSNIVSCVATENTGLRNVTMQEACRCHILEIKTDEGITSSLDGLL